MKITSSNVFVGPSIYASFPVIRHVVDLGILEAWPSGKLGKPFTDALVELLPGLEEHGCSYKTTGGFIRRLTEDEGTWMGHIWEHVTLELQNMAGSDVSFGRTRGTGDVGCYNMVFAYKQRDVGLEASRIARQILLNLLPEELKKQLTEFTESDFNFNDEIESFIHFAQRKEFGPSTGSLVAAAEERGIPWIRANNYSLVQFGHGKYQKRIQATITSETRHIAVEIACDKEDTHNLLRDLGLPVPQQRMVYNEREAVRAAERINYPVVLKPLNANHGRGVSINLETEEQVRTAFQIAKEQGTSRAVLVESYALGLDHRMLVINNELVAVAKRIPGRVIGDGKSTVAELVDEVNSDPRRGVGHEKTLTRLEFDQQAERLLEEAGFSAKTVLAKDEIFYLRDTANLSTGGTAVDVTDIVHPDNREMAVRAVMAIGLDVGGVDFLSQDISKSYKDIGGAIVEINAAPGFRMHIAPSEGQPRDVAAKVIDMLFEAGSPSRIPIAAITGTNGKTTTSRMLAHIMKTAGDVVGMTSTDGVYIDGHLSVKGDMTGPTSAQIVLRDPTVDMAVMETARGGILRSGLGYEESNVAACLNITSDHLGLRGINTLDELAKVKRVVVESATDTVVLNADDHYCLNMADYTKADRLCYVTLDPGHDLVREHIRSDGLAVVLEKGINGEMITLYDKGAHIPLLWTYLIPATLEGKAIHNVQNAMFAAAMAYAFGKSLEDIRHGLRTFNTSFFQAPGRMNVFDEHPFKVILDYAHNEAAVEAMSVLAGRLDVSGRRICTLAAPGDRRDEDILALADAAYGHYDHYICKADDNRRGRGDTEVPDMLSAQLIKRGVDPSAVEVIASESDALKHALEMCIEGDLLLVFGDNITRCWKTIIHHNAGERPTTDSDEVQESIESMSGIEKFELSDGQSLIRDGRGVRIARATEEDSD